MLMQASLICRRRRVPLGVFGTLKGILFFSAMNESEVMTAVRFSDTRIQIVFLQRRSFSCDELHLLC
jgi:hypothetical protein